MIIQLTPSLQEGLNKITSIPLRKRLIRELYSFTDPKLYVSGVYVNGHLKPIITIVEVTKNSTFNIFEFEIPRDYPFVFPILKINGQSYSSYLRIDSNILREKLYKLKKIECLCCHSYACYNNWKPMATLKIVIDEVKTIRKLRCDIIKKYYADKIKQKYLVQDIDLDSWLF
jgi:hypothetical protein